MTVPGTLLLGDGRFRVLSVLGEGATALVFRVLDTRLGAERAVKVLLPNRAMVADSRRRLRSEAALMARLSHPGVVAVHDIIEEEDRLFLVMEYAAGGTIGGWLARHGPMPARLAVEVVLAILPALRAAHEAGVVHRDLKPQNLLITARGEVKIADFGVAHLVDHSTTRTGMVLGTWAYMAPEQRAGRREIDGRADIFACGAMLYELVTGEVPPELFMSGSEPGLLSALDPVLVPVIARATQFRPEARHADVSAFEAELVALLSGLPSPPPSTPPLAGGSEGDPLDVATARALTSSGQRNLTLVADLTAAASADAGPRGDAPAARRRSPWLFVGVATFVLALGALVLAVGRSPDEVAPNPSAPVVVELEPPGEPGVAPPRAPDPPQVVAPTVAPHAAEAEVPPPRPTATAAPKAPRSAASPPPIAPSAVTSPPALEAVSPEPLVSTDPVPPAPVAPAAAPAVAVVAADPSPRPCPRPGQYTGKVDGRVVVLALDAVSTEGASGQVRTLVGQAWRSDAITGHCEDGVLLLTATARDLKLRVEPTPAGLAGVATVAGKSEGIVLGRK